MEEKMLNTILFEIKDMKKEMNEKFEQMSNEMDEKFEKVDQRFEQIDEKFEKVDQRFEQIDKRFGQIDEKFEQIDERFNQIDEKFEQLSHEVAEEIRDLSISISTKQHENFQILNNKINETNSQLNDYKEKMKTVSDALVKAVS